MAPAFPGAGSQLVARRRKPGRCIFVFCCAFCAGGYTSVEFCFPFFFFRLICPAGTVWACRRPIYVVDHRATECSSCGRCVPSSHGIAVLSPPENTDSYCCAAGASTQLYRFLCSHRENDVFYWWCGGSSRAEGAENSLGHALSPLLFREDCSLWKKLFSAAELLRLAIGTAASVAEERGTRVTIEYEECW